MMRERCLAAVCRWCMHYLAVDRTKSFCDHSFALRTMAACRPRRGFKEKLFFAQSGTGANAIEMVARKRAFAQLEPVGCTGVGVRNYLGRTAFPILGRIRRHRFGAGAGIAVDALGPDKIAAVMMPSLRPYFLDRCVWPNCMGVPVTTRYDHSQTFKASLFSEFNGQRLPLPRKTSGAHRGCMALSNKFGSIVPDHQRQERDGHRLLHPGGDMAGGCGVRTWLSLMFRLAQCF
jgi:hypothetical protein